MIDAMRRMIVTLAAGLLATAGAAEEPQILHVAVEGSGNVWRVGVTIMHPDTGWDHYVDGWEVLDRNGRRLGYRLLHHPHVNEQPFTRTLDNLVLPEGTREIFVRAHCSVDGWSGKPVRVDIAP